MEPPAGAGLVRTLGCLQAKGSVKGRRSKIFESVFWRRGEVL
jgi:hypothetical protein